MSLQKLLAQGVGLLLAAGLTSQLSSQALHRPNPGVFLPFELVSGFEILVQGQIGELDGLKFIVDTGSSCSVLDRRVADRLGLVRRPRKIFNFDRNLAVDWADIPKLRIGPIRAAGLAMMVTKLADISEFAEDADGIIGMDVLSHAQRMTIDYERRRIALEFGDGQASAAAANAFVVPVFIQGTPMHLAVDTGLQYVLLYRDRLRDALPHLRIDGEARNAAMGRLQVTQVHLPGIQIFGREAVIPVLLVEGRGRTALGGVDGYLGPASLHARRLELDFAAKTLRWE